VIISVSLPHFSMFPTTKHSLVLPVMLVVWFKPSSRS